MEPGLQAWLPAIITLLTVSPGIYLMATQRRKASAETADTLVTAATKLVQPLLDSNAALRLEVKNLTHRLELCMAKIDDMQKAQQSGNKKDPA